MKFPEKAKLRGKQSDRWLPRAGRRAEMTANGHGKLSGGHSGALKGTEGMAAQLHTLAFITRSTRGELYGM